MAEHTITELRVSVACEAAEGLAMGLRDDLTALASEYLPVIKNLLFQFGLDLAKESLPVLKAKLEEWQPRGFIMRQIRKQLLTVLDDIMESLEKNPALGDFIFAS